MSGLPTFDPGFSTEELARIYSPDGTVGAMLEFEAALALALADAGIAPLVEAEQVASACAGGAEDAQTILTSTWETGTPILALRASILARVDDESASRWFHFGATTQDAVDTAQMLQAGSALDHLVSGLASLASRLRDLTVAHRERAHKGRTFLQEARPTTFGFRTATWLLPVLGHLEDLRALRRRLTVQLGGPVGTLEGYGESATAVVEALARRLGLEAPGISWHGDRDPIMALAHSVSRTAGTMAKIGSDIAVLASTGIGEIEVRSGGSSSMPGKENPVDSFRAVAASAACSGAVTMLSSAPPVELDRGVGGWHVEWLALPLVFHTAAAAVEAIDMSVSTLEPVGPAGTADKAVIAGSSAQIDSVLEKAGRTLD
jgi:3-carboxy-cis,cis-muconate cycloisomerase